MKAKKIAVRVCAVLSVFFLPAPFAFAQQKTPSTLRQPAQAVAANDTVLEGTVVSFTADSAVAPIGPRLVLQTASGTVNVHLGKAAVLKQANITLAAGDSVRITGFSVSSGGASIFAARTLQKGAQSVTLRNSRGIPVSSAQSRAAMRASAPAQGGAR